jgi:ATP-binding cassette subfamily B protein
MNDKKMKLSFINLARRSICVVFKAAPWHCTFDISMSVFNGLSLALNIVVTKNLFDAIADAAMGEKAFWDCVPALLLFAALTVGYQILHGAYFFHWNAWHEKAAGRIKTLLFRKTQRIDPARFEETDFLNDVNKAKEAVNVIPVTMYNLSVITESGVYFATVGTYLFSLKPMLLITIMLSFFPALLAQIVRGKVFTKLEEESAPTRREFDYYKKALCDREYFKETRILGIFDFFLKLFTDSLRLLTRKTWKAERNTALLELLLNTVKFLGMGSSAYMLFTATMSGEITVGAFAAVFSSLGTIFYRMERILRNYGGIQQDIGKVNNFYFPQFLSDKGCI